VAPGGGARSSSPVVAVPAGGGVVAVPERSRQYRGVVHADAGAGPLRLLNQVDVEDYLRGLGEMPASWPQAAQGAQSIVARTYALRAMAVNGENCDYVRCQVYLGLQAEAPGKDQAVAATRGLVLGYGGQLATAVYASNHGGISATTLEGFGTPDGRYPYLRPVRYTSRDPFPWSVDVSLADLAARAGYRGTISSVAVSEKGPSGRPLQVTISGDAGETTVPALQLGRRLGLRSTLWDLRIAEAEVAPPPPPEPAPEDDVIQALPDDESALSAASLETADSIELERRRGGALEVPAAENGSDRSRTVPAAVAIVLLMVAAFALWRRLRPRRSG
jgi:SpoIID/LytB domain protein